MKTSLKLLTVLLLLAATTNLFAKQNKTTETTATNSALTGFMATPLENSVLLNWSAPDKPGAENFEVERSTDGQNFVSIGTATTGYTSESKNEYFFEDNMPEPGKLWYYRLKQTGDNNSYKFSDVVTTLIKVAVNDQVGELSPNPVLDNASIRITSSENVLAKIAILNLNGQKISECAYPLTSGITYVNLDVETLENGIYLCQVETPSGIATRKLIKSK